MLAQCWWRQHREHSVRFGRAVLTSRLLAKQLVAGRRDDVDVGAYVCVVVGILIVGYKSHIHECGLSETTSHLVWGHCGCVCRWHCCITRHFDCGAVCGDGGPHGSPLVPAAKVQEVERRIHDDCKGVEGVQAAMSRGELT